MATWKETRRSLRRPFETGGFILLKAVIPMMPRGLVTLLSNLAGHAAMLLPLREKTIGLKNIEAVFGAEMHVSEKRAILKTSFSTFCRTMLDVFWFSRKPEERILKFVQFEEGPLKEALFEDKPAICITAHMGSWEIMGQTCALMGIRIASIAATVKTPVVDRILIGQRERTGQTIIPQKGALKSLIAWFRKKGKVAFVLDQNTPENEGGIMADFLGFPMPVSSAPAALAYRTGTEIIFGFCLPEPRGRYRIRLTKRIVPPPFEKNLDADEIARMLTQQILDEISAEIRKHPQFWLWSYKHWRRIPGEHYPDRYPQY